MNNFEINFYEAYPKVFTPRYLKDASNANVPFEEIFPNNDIPKLDKLSKTWGSIFEIIGILYGLIMIAMIGSLIVMLLTFLISYIFDFTYNEDIFFKIILPIIGIALWISFVFLYFRYKYKENNKIEEENKKRYRNYQNELEKHNRYLSSKQFIDRQNEERIKRCIKLSENNKRNIFKKLEIINDYEIKKGLTEEFFYKFLSQKSDFTIYKSVKFSYYYPDLLLIKNNLVVALEIDEPYSFDSKQPIHFENSDKDRDIYFVNNGFILIRFTENQILSETEKCLEFIQNVIDSCLELKDKINRILLNDIKENVLTREEAFNLAYNNSRGGLYDVVKHLELKYKV